MTLLHERRRGPRQPHGAVAPRPEAGRQVADLRQLPDRYRRTGHLRPSALPSRGLGCGAAQRDGLSVRPMIVTLIGYLVIIDAAINMVGWALDLVAGHTILARILLNGWGAMFDAGYFWHFNELWLGGAAGPGEKAMEVGFILTVFTMRIAAAIGFLQMKRWGHQWMIITCWMGVLIWCRLRVQHDHVRRRPLLGRRVPGRRLVALRHLLHHAVPGDPLSTLRQPRDLLRLILVND